MIDGARRSEDPRPGATPQKADCDCGSTWAQGRRVLVVEDDPAMTVALTDGFSSEGCEVLLATDGEEGVRLAETVGPDLIILDVMLPKLNGLDVCRRLRSQGSAVPIIMLTARGQEIDRVLGLKLGADDYVTKPFSLLELLARAEAILRRTDGDIGTAAPETYEFGSIRVDFRHHECHRNGQPLALSPREFLLLQYFIRHRGEVLTREHLLDAVWGYDQIPFTRTVDAHIAKLRKKVEEKPADPQFLVTVHRLGYKFVG